MTAIDEIREGDLAAGIVPRSAYYDPDVLELEKKRIFERSWHYVCTVHDLKKAGDYFTVTVADQAVMVVRGNDGQLRAFYNACTHRGALLTELKCGSTGQIFKCMYHAWAFDLTGDLVAVPYPEDYPADFKRENFRLTPVSVDTFGDLVFVALRPKVESLQEYMGEMWEWLLPYITGIEPIGRNSWIYGGNWKLWHENFRDNYHPEFTHRQIHDMTPHYADRGGNWAKQPGHSILMWRAEKPNMKRYERSLQRLSGIKFDMPEGALGLQETDVVHGEVAELDQTVIALYPNLDIQPGPAGAEKWAEKQGFIQVVTPLTPSTARVDLIAYSDVNDTPEERELLLETLADMQGSWGKLSVDDAEAAYRCHNGILGQGHRTNLFTRTDGPGTSSDTSGRTEYSQREFYRVYQQYMADES